jgi:hypothetical protein
MFNVMLQVQKTSIMVLTNFAWLCSVGCQYSRAIAHAKLASHSAVGKMRTNFDFAKTTQQRYVYGNRKERQRGIKFSPILHPPPMPVYKLGLTGNDQLIMILPDNAELEVTHHQYITPEKSGGRRPKHAK